jgi:hypothetical protein
VGFGVRLLESPQALSRLDRSTAEGEYRHNSIEDVHTRKSGTESDDIRLAER